MEEENIHNIIVITDSIAAAKSHTFLTRKKNMTTSSLSGKTPSYPILKEDSAFPTSKTKNKK